MQIFVKNHTDQMEASRRQLRAQVGDAYEAKVAPYRSTILMYCKKSGLEPYPATRYLLRLMARKRARKHRILEPHVRAAMFAAALDIQEQNLL